MKKIFFASISLVAGFIIGYCSVVYFSEYGSDNRPISVHIKKVFFSNEKVKR